MTKENFMEDYRTMTEMKMATPKYKPGDRVQLLNGAKIPDFTGDWMSYMGRDIGVCTIDYYDELFSDDTRVAYRLKENGWVWDERAMILIESAK